jgi:hypothetical protein
MLVEIDNDDLLSIGERQVIYDDLELIRMAKPYFFSASDIISKKVRFLFRSKDELALIVSRAQANVAECKSIGITEAWGIENFAVIDGFDCLIDFGMLNVKKGQLSEAPTGDLAMIWADYVKRDRLDGAKVGFRAGQWIRSLNSERFIDTMREPMTFEIWRKSLTPEINALINMICGDIELKWDVNRSAIVDFCARCWKECFSVSHSEERHEILRSIARSVADTTYVYPVDDIQDAEMQALACFIIAGKREGALIQLLKTMRVRLPELALALHGALVGYSVLSRVLFEKRSYVDAEENQEDAFKACVNRKSKKSGKGEAVPLIDDAKNGRQIKTVPKVSDGGMPDWINQIWDKVQEFIKDKKIKGKKRSQVENALHQAVLECKDKCELLRVLSENYKSEGWGRGTQIYKYLKKVLEEASAGNLFDKPIQSLSVSGLLLIHDAELLKEISIEFANIGEERICLLKDAVSKFVAMYMPNGFYGQQPEKYKQLNPDLIDHMIRCFISPKTPKLNFKFDGIGEDRFVSFLEKRYHCKRRTS